MDKPLSLLFPNIYSGRGVFHAPSVCILITLGLFWGCKHNELPIAFSIGFASHLILDLPNIPFFWPIAPIEIYRSEISGWISNLLGNPFYLASEIAGLVGILGMGNYFFIRKRNKKNYNSASIF